MTEKGVVAWTNPETVKIVEEIRKNKRLATKTQAWEEAGKYIRLGMEVERLGVLYMFSPNLSGNDRKKKREDLPPWL